MGNFTTLHGLLLTVVLPIALIIVGARLIFSSHNRSHAKTLEILGGVAIGLLVVAIAIVPGAIGTTGTWLWSLVSN